MTGAKSETVPRGWSSRGTGGRANSFHSGQIDMLIFRCFLQPERHPPVLSLRFWQWYNHRPEDFIGLNLREAGGGLITNQNPV
jgi:hypothetical protein